MKIFQRAGCGCVIIPIDEELSITVNYCGESNGVNFSNPNTSVMPDNRRKAVWLTDSEHEEIFNEINRLIHQGRRFEALTQALGIKP